MLESFFGPARLVRDLTLGAASRGAAVVWTTQRLDEIRGFAQAVTILNRGTVCFNGGVPELMGPRSGKDRGPGPCGISVLKHRNGYRSISRTPLISML